MTDGCHVLRGASFAALRSWLPCEKNEIRQVCAEIFRISTFQRANKVCPELSFLCERNVLGVEVEGSHSEKLRQIKDWTLVVLDVFVPCGSWGATEQTLVCPGRALTLMSVLAQDPRVCLFWGILDSGKSSNLFLPRSPNSGAHTAEINSLRQPGSQKIKNYQKYKYLNQTTNGKSMSSTYPTAKAKLINIKTSI